MGLLRLISGPLVLATILILGGCGGETSSQVDYYGAKAVAAAYVGSMVVESAYCVPDALGCTRDVIDTLMGDDFSLSDVERQRSASVRSRRGCAVLRAVRRAARS